tara:strand:+ start:2854 stop:3468 length:615 start_codon:yes stop_codon:yes gene_type:complete
MTFFVWSQFALVCLLGAMSPGPSLALIINNSIQYNRISGIIASIAHGLGIFIYATSTVIILEFILRNSETIYFIIQVFGSIFLMFLGLFFLFKKINDKELGNNKINSNSFVQGFVIAIINPKILVWFVAIYSQFINLNANLSDKIILVLTPSLVDAIWYSVVAILVTGYGLKDFLNKNKLIIQRTIGIFLIIIALSVIYSLVNF